MTTLSIAEVLEITEEATGETNKIQVLRKNISRPLLDVLIGAYDDRVEWLLPKGVPPYSPGPPTGAETALLGQTKTLYLFVKEGGAPKGLSQKRREQLFIQMLESVDPKDAIVMTYIKDKKLPPQYRSITKELVDKAFPNMLFLEQSPTSSVPEDVYIPEEMRAAAEKVEEAKKTPVKRKPAKRKKKTAPKTKRSGIKAVTQKLFPSLDGPKAE